MRDMVFTVVCPAAAVLARHMFGPVARVACFRMDGMYGHWPQQQRLRLVCSSVTACVCCVVTCSAVSCGMLAGPWFCQKHHEAALSTGGWPACKSSCADRLACAGSPWSVRASLRALLQCPARRRLLSCLSGYSDQAPTASAWPL